MVTGYKLSKDYEKLYDLVKDGRVIVGWVNYRHDSSSRDVVQIQERNFGNAWITAGVRGVEYIGVYDYQWNNRDTTEKECFITDCKNSNLEFIDPESQKHMQES